jgi:cytochrome P450
MEVMLNAKVPGWSKQGVKSSLLTFLFAGHDTSASTLMVATRFLKQPVDLNSFIREVGRESRKVPARSTSVDDGAIRDQHRALSEECGAICKRNKVSSIELEVIHERCGAISRRRNATETK